MHQIKAFAKAWTDFCSATGDSATLEIPANKAFLLKSTTFRGPCKSNSVNIQVKYVVCVCVSLCVSSYVQFLDYYFVSYLVHGRFQGPLWHLTQNPGNNVAANAGCLSTMCKVSVLMDQEQLMATAVVGGTR